MKSGFNAARESWEWSHQQAMKMLAEAKKRGLRDYMLLAMAINTGARISELVEMTTENIIWNNGKVWVDRRKQNKKECLQCGDIKVPKCLKGKRKGEKACRTCGSKHLQRAHVRDEIFVHEDFISKLKHYVKRMRIPPKGWLFPRANKTGSISSRWANKIFDFCAAKVGIKVKGRNMHGFRHHYAFELMRSGADIGTIQAQLGHRSLSATQFYIHAVHRRKTVKKMGAFL